MFLSRNLISALPHPQPGHQVLADGIRASPTSTTFSMLIAALLCFQTSSICKTAVHAGVIGHESGGYVDVMPVDKKKAYVGSLRNGVQSER